MELKQAKTTIMLKFEAFLILYTVRFFCSKSRNSLLAEVQEAEPVEAEF